VNTRNLIDSEKGGRVKTLGLGEHSNSKGVKRGGGGEGSMRNACYVLLRSFLFSWATNGCCGGTLFFLQMREQGGRFKGARASKNKNLLRERRKREVNKVLNKKGNSTCRTPASGCSKLFK